MNELAMIGAILLAGVIFWFTHDDEDEYYPAEDIIELEGIPIEELE